MHIQPGQRISAPLFLPPREVTKFETRTGDALLEVVLQDGHQTSKALRLSPEQLSQIEILDHRQAEYLLFLTAIPRHSDDENFR